MGLQIKKNSQYGETSVTFIGLTHQYGRPQYILVSSDEGLVKFPGLRYRAALNNKDTLDGVAERRFEEQTGLKVSKNLGLRVIMPTRSRHSGHWIFRYISLGLIEDLFTRTGNDRERSIYVADVGRGIRTSEVEVTKVGESEKRERLEWIISDNREVAQIATDIAYHFDWINHDTNWYKRIPCVSAEPQTNSSDRPLGCGLAVASMILLYKPDVGEPFHTVLVEKRKDLEYEKRPGFAGGKIETPESKNNLDPISCCMAEGEEELGFKVRPTGIICCAQTALDAPDGENFYVGIDNVAFVAEPVNPRDVKEALAEPGTHLEKKMGRYVVESLDVFRDRVDRNDLRTADMANIGKEFFRTTPGEKILLTQIRSSGVI